MRHGRVTCHLRRDTRGASASVNGRFLVCVVDHRKHPADRVWFGKILLYWEK